MSDLKISQLPELYYGEVQNGDYLPVVDISSGVTKKIRSDSFWMPVSDVVTEQAGIATNAKNDALAIKTEIRNWYYGPLATDPTTRPDGTAMQEGDEYHNSTDHVRKVYSSGSWIDVSLAALVGSAGAAKVGAVAAGGVGSTNVQVYLDSLDSNKASKDELAASDGSSKVGYDGGTVQDVLDNAKPMQSYTALRAYTGRATAVRITTPGISGFFQRLGTIGLTDNGGTIIVDASGRAWERLYSGTVSVSWFGAVGNNSTDDAASINAADVYAKSAGKCLQFEGKTYLIKSPIAVSAPWIAVANSTTIRIPSDFVYPTALSAPRKYSAVVNKNCASTYSPATADGVYMSGFTFIDEGGASGFDTVAFGNVKAGCMTDCVFTTNTSTTKTPLDLFACVKNFTIERSRSYNNTQAGSGGCMWVRNITSDGSIEANNTENIYVYACYFEQTAGDEAFAVYGVNGVSRNVKVVNCTFKGATSSQPHGSLVTAFPLGSTANAAVQDVLFSNCRFESSNFTNNIFRAGQTEDASRVCKDIRVENSYFKASLPAAGTSAVARNIPGVGGNITFVNNIIDAEGSANTITYGAQNFDAAFNNTVGGAITYAFYLCSVVDACISKVSVSTGAYNCGQVTNCDITSAGTAVLATTTGKYVVSNNKLTLTGTTGNPYGVFFNTVGASAPYGDITGNKISMNYANAVAVRNAGTGVSNTRVNNNRVDGVGKSIQGTQFLEVQGNSWFGVLDSMRNAGYLDYDHNIATPIGTFATAATHTVGTSRYLLGFIKTANAGVGADWKSVYVENANN